MEIYAPVVARNVKHYRLLRGYTQHHLAELAEISRDSLAHLERGMTNPTLKTLVSLASALGVSPYQLLRETEGEGSHDAKSET